MNLSPFEKKCLALNLGYDHDVCEGRFCTKRQTCVRYMLYKKAKLEGYKERLIYIVCNPRYNECYVKYQGKL